MWELSDDRYMFLKRGLDNLKKMLEEQEAKKKEAWTHFVAGYLGAALPGLIGDLETARRGNGMTDEDFERLEEEVEAKR